MLTKAFDTRPLLFLLIVILTGNLSLVGCVRQDLAQAFGHEMPPEQQKPAEQTPPAQKPPGQKTGTTPAPSSSGTSGSLQVIESRIITEQGIKYVTGMVRNGTKQHYRYVEVQINLYDKSGSLLTTISRNSSGANQSLPPGSTWKFKAMIVDNRATSHRIKAVKGFI